MQVRTTNTAVSDFDIDVGLFPLLGLKFFPFHIAIGSRGIFSQPALELVIL